MSLIPRPPRPPPRPAMGPDPLRTIAGQFWNQWPARWESNLASQIPADNIGRVINNLVRMRKRITIAQKDRIRVSDLLARVRAGQGLAGRTWHRPQVI